MVHRMRNGAKLAVGARCRAREIGELAAGVAKSGARTRANLRECILGGRKDGETSLCCGARASMAWNKADQ